MKKIAYLPLVVFIIAVFYFFSPFLIYGKLPIPSDTIIGLYHPFRDLYAKDYPRGIPFKNFLITDSVRQQYPWRELSIFLEKQLKLPLWNPYSFSGTPLLANFQSAVFYPPNLLFFVFPFQDAWLILVILQPLLAGIFLYLYLQNLKVSKTASFMGGFVFAFSGFSVAWMEWNTVIHVGLWLPLILLSIDKIFFYLGNPNNSKFRVQSSKLQFKIKNLTIWGMVFVFSLTSSFFAGHLQTFFYLLILSLIYLFSRWVQFGKKISILILFTIYYLLFTIITAVQWIPTMQFILESARDIDQIDWQKEGWFIPWQHLIQFIAPDFFGNPTTLNYWGVWNYAEFVGYIGVLPFVMAVLALFFRKDKKTLFFGTLFFISLIFSLPTIFAKIPYMFNIPFVSTSQPTRLLFITDFCLAILSAFGLDYFMRNTKKIVYPLGFIFLVFASLWIFVLWGNQMLQLVSGENLEVARRNLILPTILFFISIILIVLYYIFSKRRNLCTLLLYCILVITIFDLMRFAQKFTPFTNKEYLFPTTKAIDFLQKNAGYSRIMSVDSRILPPNFSVIYRLQSVDGYDPLYLKRYGELIAASERGKPDIEPPGFNRIITPHNYDSKIIDLLGVKYILSLSDLQSPKLQKIFQEGETRVYENKDALPRTFFVQNIMQGDRMQRQESIRTIFKEDFDFRKDAHIVDTSGREISFATTKLSMGFAKIIKYSENYIMIETINEGVGFLVLTDGFYPSWRVKIDGVKRGIYLTDYNFRGVLVPAGEHLIEFYITLL